MAVAPWIVSDALWKRVEPLLPRRERRFRYPGRKRLPERAALQGILFVLHTGIAWRHLPLALGFGSGSTCYRRLDEWQRAGVWERLHALLLAELPATGEIEWSPGPPCLRPAECISAGRSILIRTRMRPGVGVG
jgi:transposase